MSSMTLGDLDHYTRVITPYIDRYCDFRKRVPDHLNFFEFFSSPEPKAPGELIV